MLNDVKNILIVGAHPDDETLGCGATIKKMIDQGVNVSVLILGEGSSCRFNSTEFSSELLINALKQRKKSCLSAMNILGVKNIYFENLPCGRFDTVPIIDIGKIIEKHIALSGCDTLVTHFGGDTNSDHRITFNAAMVATRPVPSSNVRNLLVFETPSSTEWRYTETFSPNLFVSVSDYIESKVLAFSEYAETEGAPFPFPRSADGLRYLARYRGMQAGIQFAEAFQIIRLFT